MAAMCHDCWLWVGLLVCGAEQIVMLLAASSEIWQHCRSSWLLLLYLQQHTSGPSWLRAWWVVLAGSLDPLSTCLAADVVGQSKTEVLLVSETASPSLADIILGPLKQREAQGSPQQAIALQAGATDSPLGTLSNASSWGTPTQASSLGVHGQRQHLQAPVAGSSPGKLVARGVPARHGAGVGSLAALGTGWGPPRQRSAPASPCMNRPALSPSGLYVIALGKKCSCQHEQTLHPGLSVSISQEPALCFVYAFQACEHCVLPRMAKAGACCCRGTSAHPTPERSAALRLPCWLQSRGLVTRQIAGSQAPASADMDVLGLYIRNAFEIASPAHCAVFQPGPQEVAHAPPATAFSAGSLGGMYSTGGSSDRGWAAGMGAPEQVRSLAVDIAWLPKRARAASALGTMWTPAWLHCTDRRLL